MMGNSNDWVGKTLGSRYKIEKLLGKGGMSAVYKAYDPNLKRLVAVKMIHAHLSQNPEFVGRFETEAAAVARLRHPNIVQVYDFNHDEGLFYMVLEFLEGETLYERLQMVKQDEKRMEIKDAIRYALNVSEAVEYAHQKNMYHRDIKPANVMITPQDQAVLMDFGIAKIVGEQAHTAAGNVIGTVRYMAPEQILGQQADHRADIYSTGVMLFEMLAGRAPFEGDSAVSMMRMHLQEPIPNLQELGPEIPANLVAVTTRALEKEPAKRFQTAGELANALKKALIQFENKEAALFHTVRLSQDDLEDMYAPTQQIALPDLPGEAGSPDPGKTRIIDEEQLEGVSQPAEAAVATGDSFKTVAVDYELLKQEQAPQTDKMSTPEAWNQQASVKSPQPAQASAASRSVEVEAGSRTAIPVDDRRSARKFNPLLLGGGIVALLVLAGVLAFALGIFNAGGKTASQATSTSTIAALAVQPTATQQSAPTVVPTEAATPTQEMVGVVSEEPYTTQDTEGVVSEDPDATSAPAEPVAGQPGDIIFQAEFEDPTELNQLNISGDDTTGEAFSADITGGQLQLTVANAQAALYAEYNLLLENPDVRVETQASKVAGPNSNEIGVFCRSSEQGFYFLAYSSAGNWIIYRFQPGTGENGWNTLASGKSNSIRMANETNQIAGTCAGTQLVLEVNGTQLGTVSDEALSTGGYAGAAIWGEFPGLGVNFDYLVASLP